MSNESRSLQEGAKKVMDQAQKAAMPLGLILLMLGVFSRLSRYMRWSALSMGGGEKMMYDIEPAKLLWGGALLILLLSALRKPHERFLRMDGPLRILLVFAGFAFMSLMWSYNYAFALPWVFRLHLPVLVYMLISSYTRTWRHVESWTRLFLIMGGAAFVFAAHEILFVVGRLGVFLKHTVGGDQYVGEYCRWSVIAFSAAVYFMLYPRKPWERYAGILVSLCALGTIYITYRRTAVLGIGVVMLVYLFTVGMRRKVLWVAPLLGVLLLVGVLGANPRYARRLATIPFVGGKGGIEDFDERARLEQFMAGVKTSRDHWLYGIGFGTTMLYFQQVHHVGLTLPHNIVLRLIGELGIFGFGLFAAFIGSGMMRMWRVYKRKLADGDERGAGLAVSLLAALIAISFYALFQPILYDTFFYILVAVGSCMYSAVFDPEEEETPVADDRAG